MKCLSLFEPGLKRPASNITPFIILAALSILPIINFFGLGYLLELARQSMKGHHTIMPRWENWGKLFLEGLGYFVIFLVWFLPAIIVGIIAFVAFFGAVFMVENGVNTDVIPPTPFAIALSLSMFGLCFLFALVAGYFVPLALLGYASKRKLSAGFEFRVIADKAFTLEYFLATLLLWLLNLAVFIVTLLFSFIPFAGLFVSMIMGLWFSVLEFTVLGGIYKGL